MENITFKDWEKKLKKKLKTYRVYDDKGNFVDYFVLVGRTQKIRQKLKWHKLQKSWKI
jgi:capsule polysaccharide export protein KpsE/RkpR